MTPEEIDKILKPYHYRDTRYSFPVGTIFIDSNDASVTGVQTETVEQGRSGLPWERYLIKEIKIIRGRVIMTAGYHQCGEWILTRCARISDEDLAKALNDGQGVLW